MSAKKAVAKAVIDPSRPPGLRVGQIYLSHARFDYIADPLTLAAPTQETEVKMTVDLQTFDMETPAHTQMSGVRVRVRTAPECLHPYRFDVSVGAVIEPQQGEENYPASDYVKNAGAALLFPFVRETIANITMRGRFGPVWIPPFNVQLAMTGKNLQK